MASGAVRELIAKVKFRVDNNSLNATNNAIKQIKQKLNQLGQSRIKINVRVNSAAINSAINQIKNQMAHLNLNIHAQASVATIRATTVNLYGHINNHGGGGGNGGGHGGNGGGQGNALADNAGTLAATGAAMIAPLALPVKTAMDFEAALSSVQAKLGLTKAEMAGISEEAKKLGSETQFSSVQVLQAADYLAMAGWKEKDIRAGLKDMLQLSIAGNMDLARTADIVSDGLTALNMTAADTAHFNDIMATAASNSNTDISIMGETFKQLLPVAGALGYSIDDVGLAIELMADKGLKGERAGSSMVAVLNGLAKPTKEAAMVIEELGVKMFDETGKALPLKSVIEQLRGSFAGLTDEQKQTYASTIAGVDGMKGLLDIVGATDERYNEFVGTIENANGATERMAKVMHDNAQGSVQDLMSALQGLAQEIGEAFLGAVGDAAKGIASFVQKLTAFAKAHPKLVAGIVAFVAAAGSLLVILGGIGLALSGVMTAMGALGPVFGAIGGVLSAGFAPILAIIAAVAAAIYFVSENWDMVVEMFKPGLAIMEDGLQQLAQAWEALQPLIQALTPLIKFLANLIGGVIVAALAVLFAAASTVFNAIASFINWVCGLLGEMGSIIQWCADLLGGLISKAMDFIGLKGQIGDINTDTTNRLFDEGRAGGNYTQSQYNNFNLSSANQLQPAMAGTNTWFDNP